MPLRARRIGGGLVGLALLTIGLGGCAEPTVLRVIDGNEVRGRFVSDYAYALYGRGVYQDAKRDEMPDTGSVPRRFLYTPGLAALEAAASEDTESAHLWTAIGALRCRLPRTDLEGAEKAFARARGIEPEYAPLYREIARCRATAEAETSDPALAKARRDEALAAVETALRLDPDDVDAASVAASLLVGAGRVGEASRLLRALVIRRPGSIEAWLSLIPFARATHDEALLERASRKARELAPRRAAELEAGLPALAPLAEVDEALRRDDLAAARRHAQRAHLPLAEVAARAAALGHAGSARAEAEVVLAADPADITARIALAVAADLAADPAALGAAMEAIPAPPAELTAPSPLAGLLFAELLCRRVNEGAARAWLAALPAAAAPPGDALLGAVSARVHARFADRAPQVVAR